MKKLLNIDGGGIRVYFSLLILNYIEKKTGKNILDLFDYFAGVSASSIVLSALLTKYTVQDMLKLFKEISEKIFYRSLIHMVKSGFGFFDSKYTDYYINIELEKMFENYKLNDLKKPLSILTYDLKTSKALCFYSYKKNSDNDLWKIIRGSTAAPTYFCPYILDNHIMIDGGVVTNNLSEAIFVDALEYYGHNEEFFQLSIGTGFYRNKTNNIPSGILSWLSSDNNAGSIIDVFFNASSSYEMSTLDKLYKLECLKNFYRVDVELPVDIKLDDCNSFDLIEKIFNDWINEDINKNYLDNMIQELLL